jgi:hypothetical protein
MKQLKLIFIGLCSLLWLFGCYEDEGNYTYVELPDFYIDTTGVQTSFTLTQFSPFSLPSYLKYAKDKTDLTYSWSIYHSSIGQVTIIADTLATTENLNTEIRKSPGNYILEFCAIEKTTGLKAMMQYEITVESAVGRGLIVFYETKGNEVDCDLIRSKLFVGSITNEEVIRNIYSQANPDYPLKGTVVRCGIMNGTSQHIYLFTDIDGVKVSSEDVTILQYFNQLFYTVPDIHKPQGIFAKINPSSYASGGVPRHIAKEFFVNDGRIHENNVTSPFAYEKVGIDYEAAPYILMAYGQNMFAYDQKNMRFLYGGSYSSVVLVIPKNNGAFDFSDIGKKMLYEDYGFGQCSNSSGQGYMAYTIMRNEPDDGKRYIYPIDISQSSYSAYIAKPVLDISECTDIEKTSLYAFGVRGPVVFYAVNNRLYQINYNWDAATVTGSSAVWDFNSDEKITCLKMFVGEGVDLTEKIESKYLMVGTYNETTEEGKVYILEADIASGKLNATPVGEYNGFGKVKDIQFKMM